MLLKVYTLILFSIAAQFALGKAIPVDAVDLSERSPSGSAGLRWGPYYVGALKLYITNPHTGYAGPKFNTAPHINVHVDRKVGRVYKEVVNLHVVKYTRARRQCLYIWDSKSRKTILDKCFDSFKDAAKEAVETVKDVVDVAMDGVAFVAKLAAMVALGIALVAVIVLGSFTAVVTG